MASLGRFHLKVVSEVERTHKDNSSFATFATWHSSHKQIEHNKGKNDSRKNWRHKKVEHIRLFDFHL